MLKVTYLVVLTLIMSGCVSSGRIIGKHGVVYTEYYENITNIDSPKIKIHAIETLGNERLPKNYSLSESDRGLLRSPNTIKTVFEVYVTNNSDEDVGIVFGKFKSGGFWGDYNGESHTVSPGKHVKSSAYVSVVSTYKAIKGSYQLEIIINGQVHKLTGNINRTPAKH